MNPLAKAIKRVVRIGYRHWRTKLQKLTQNVRTCRALFDHTVNKSKLEQEVLAAQPAIQDRVSPDLIRFVYSSMYPDDPAMLMIDEKRVELAAKFIFERISGKKDDQAETSGPLDVGLTRDTRLASVSRDLIACEALKYREEFERGQPAN